VNSESAIEVLIDTVLNSQNNELPLPTVFEQLFLEPHIFNYLNSNITNKELLERLIILTIVAALLGKSESAAINLL